MNEVNQKNHIFDQMKMISTGGQKKIIEKLHKKSPEDKRILEFFNLKEEIVTHNSFSFHED